MKAHAVSKKVSIRLATTAINSITHSIALIMKLKALSPSLRSRILSITRPLSTRMNLRHAALDVLTICLSMLDETLNCNSSGMDLYCL